MRSRIRVRDPARPLRRVPSRVAEETEDGDRVGIAVLLRQPIEVDGAAVEPRRRAGLQPALRQLQVLQPRREGDSRRIAGAARAVVLQPDMNPPVEEGPGRQDHSLRTEANAHLRDDTRRAAAFQQDVVHRLLEQPQVVLVLQPAPDRPPVQHPVGLGARGAHRRALAAVQDPKLDPRLVGGLGHRPAERIDLLDQMPFADAADRRVAAHLAEGLEAMRQQQRGTAHARGGQRRFGAGMAAADDDDVEVLRIDHVRAGAGAERGQTGAASTAATGF